MKPKSDPVKKAAGKPRSDAKASRPADQSGNAVDAQPKPGREVGGFPIVGIGASAGGLSAFEAFFSGMPADTEPGMAFVLVQHLAPDHKSILTDLIRRYTRMRVFEVEDGMTVQPNCAYIIPPGRDMAFLNGTLQLLEPAAPRGQRMPIDFFFRSLAQDQRERAIGVVLSGTGSDGTLGVRAIKGEGGMVMVQNPASTEYDGMPRSAMATGFVDYELPPAEMPAQLIAYVTHAFGEPPRPATLAPKTENALKKIFVLLRVQTGHDFSHYKPSTLQRRIERRMAVHQIESMDGYVKFSQQTPVEVDALFRDMLIGVTSFFRDPGAFTAIEEQVIPKLFAGKPDDAAIRVWVPGCSTGEEAYSLAILLAERQEALKKGFKVQVFATDIDSHALAAARAGIYPASVAADLTPERLALYFAAEPGDGAYRVHKSIRDMLVFSEQNVIKDPPFSKLDLISCRNLLIYLDGDLQKKLIPLFHYALNPGGYLFLGTSETVSEFGDLFATLERKQKIYQRKEDLLGAQRAGLGRFLPPMTAIDAALPHAAGKMAGPKKLPLRELTEQALLQQVVQAGALVNDKGDILYLHGRTGMYLEPAPGESGPSNILKMAREGLRRDLTMALHKAAGTGDTVRCPGLGVKTNGDVTTVNLIVRPVAATPSGSPEPPLYLVILERAQEPVIVGQVGKPSTEEPASVDADARIAELKRELQAKEEYLQTANEELETFNEELKSSNEEMQSVNEELQSTNEELETSKEELQSLNEELATVNAELQTKVADLTRANNDMNNLLAGTGIATLFVDNQLRLLRFTPAATKIINLIQSDIGGSVGRVVSNLPGYGTLTADIQAVLDTLIPRELDVRSAEGRWYTMRILPYRTINNVIEGAVLTFVDTTEARKLLTALRQSEDLLSRAQEIAHTGSWKLDIPANRLTWSDEIYRIFGCEPQAFAATYEAFLDFVHPDDRAAVDETYSRSLREVADGYEIDHRIVRRNSGVVRHVHERCVHERDHAGAVIQSTGMVQDITERKRAEAEVQVAQENLLAAQRRGHRRLQKLNRELDCRNRELQDFVQVASHDLRSPLVNIRGFGDLLAAACDRARTAVARIQDAEALKAELLPLLEEEIPESLDYIRAGSTKMNTLLAELLNLSRVGSAALTIEQLDMNRMLAEIVASMKLSLEQAGASVQLEALPPCYGDAIQIGQVFSNLLDNALKYLDPDRPGLIRVSAHQKRNEVLYCVEDNGIGIDAKQQDAIFGLFYRLNPDRGDGQGLGLTIARRVLDRQGGEIRLESVPNQGSMFFVSLPSEPSPKSARAKRHRPSEAEVRP